MKKRHYIITTQDGQELFYGTSKRAFAQSAAIGGRGVRKISNKAELRELLETTK